MEPLAVRRSDLEEYAVALGEVCAEVFDDAISIIWKGSAYKPWDGPYDFLPGLSDLDVHVYRSSPVLNPWSARRRIFRELGSPPGNTPLQLMVIDVDRLPDPWSLFHGGFRVLQGEEPPVPATSPDEVRARDRRDLEGAAAQAESVAAGVIDRPDDQLWAYLVRVRWMFPSMLNRCATAAGLDPVAVWTMNRTSLLDAVAGVGALTPVRDAVLSYFEAALTAGAVPGNGLAAELALRAGHALLLEADGWYRRRDG
ncbi:MAG: hypothetical protein KJN71_04165 [Acidimicrobiia bacterium]|nr:hypothetical protein [Acidimicrobiia bacterium]